MGDNGDPCGIPVFVSIQALSCPVYAIRVRLPCRKLATVCITHSGNPFFFRIASSLSCDVFGKAPAKSRLSIDTTHPGRARHAVWTHEVSSPIADKVDRSFRAPI